MRDCNHWWTSRCLVQQARIAQHQALSYCNRSPILQVDCAFSDVVVATLAQALNHQPFAKRTAFVGTTLYEWRLLLPLR